MNSLPWKFTWIVYFNFLFFLCFQIPRIPHVPIIWLYSRAWSVIMFHDYTLLYIFIMILLDLTADSAQFCFIKNAPVCFVHICIILHYRSWSCMILYGVMWSYMILHDPAVPYISMRYQSWNKSKRYLWACELLRLQYVELSLQQQQKEHITDFKQIPNINNRGKYLQEEGMQHMMLFHIGFSCF